MPKVSVVIPAYNAARFIRQTLDSAAAQTFRDFEIIVVDDGSQDETAQIAQAFDDSIRLIQKPNGGVSSARNVGMQAARGEYVAFLDADDLWEKSKLEQQVALLDENPSVGLCYAATERVDETGAVVTRIAANAFDDYTTALLLYSCIVSGSCSSAMMRRELFERAGGFDANFKNYEDWEYWLRLSLITDFAPLPEFLVKYRVTTGSASGNPRRVEMDMQKILDKFFAAPDLPEKYQKLRAQTYSNNWLIVAGEYLHAGQFAASARCLLKALRYYPANVRRPLGLPMRLTKRLLVGA